MTVTEPFKDDLFFDEDEGPGESPAAHGVDGTAPIAAVVSQPSQLLESHHGVGVEYDPFAPYDPTLTPSTSDLEDVECDDEASSSSAKIENLSINSSSESKTKKKKFPKSPKRPSKPNAPPSKRAPTQRTPETVSGAGLSLSRPSDVFRAPPPIPSPIVESLSSYPPVDWSDSFTLPFNLSLDRDSSSWFKFCKEFDRVTSSSELQRFISCELNASSQAFLCVDPKGKIRLVHNLLIGPDSGNFLNPVPSFIGLCHAKFGSPPICFDTDDIDSGLLLNVDYSGVPSATEIFETCAYDTSVSSSKKKRPDDRLPSFKFDFAAFGNLKKPKNPSDPDAPENSFTCKGIFPVHPSFSGELLRLFLKHGYGTPRCGAPSIASGIFNLIISRWTCCTPIDAQKKLTLTPIDHDLFKVALPLFRFLWFAHHKYASMDTVSFEVPATFDSSLLSFKSHLGRLFPKFHGDSASPALPPTPTTGLPQAPHGNPPASLTSTTPVAAAAPPSSSSVSADAIYMADKLSEQFSESLMKHSKNLSKEKDEEKREIFKHTSHLRNGIVFGQVGPDTVDLPQSPSEIATELFRQKSTHTLYSTIHARVFRKSDNACHILFGQCGVLQKYGLGWRGDDHPRGFSPFSFDPNGCSGSSSHRSLDHDIQHDIYESSLRHDNGLSTKDMRDIFVNEKLFFPLTCDEYAMQLRSYYLFACAIWNENSYACLQIHKMVEHFLSNRFIYRNSQDFDPTFLCRVLFSIDFAIQRFIDKSLEDAECLEDIRCDKLDFHFNKLGDKIESKEDICKMLLQFFLNRRDIDAR